MSDLPICLYADELSKTEPRLKCEKIVVKQGLLLNFLLNFPKLNLVDVVLVRQSNFKVIRSKRCRLMGIEIHIFNLRTNARNWLDYLQRLIRNRGKEKMSSFKARKETLEITLRIIFPEVEESKGVLVKDRWNILVFSPLLSSH